jgi:hypothetical protein
MAFNLDSFATAHAATDMETYARTSSTTAPHHQEVSLRGTKDADGRKQTADGRRQTVGRQTEDRRQESKERLSPLTNRR